ncbi:ATP-binding protein [Mucilaginibacter terrae]|uniref:histidine kinase n=1 Tax=Mucilaginibacter terrae TaxID=1955052 RepID=A0ABU3GMG3_9SPHI|nr:ATP-binding protein [Mucilaginibacter terrae]MDT3400979.1 signal transduction histidine kinase/ActR/RegA family two-component response regulator [Mucilaginibacter terrae]
MKIQQAAQYINKWSGSETLLNAQLKLFTLMLSANVLKGGIYLYDAIYRHGGEGSGRAVRLMVTSVVIIFVLRKFPKIIQWGIHYAVLATIAHVYYRAFNKSVGLDAVTMQAIIMVIISAFYGLGKKWGTVYTLIAAASTLLIHYIKFRFTGLIPLPQHLNDIYIAVNWVVILISHLYFHGVLYGNLKASKILSLQLAEAAQAKTNFLSTMSHELRTPLNSVIGIAGLLISDDANSKQKEQLDVLKFSAEGLLTLINDILDINKLDAGKLELESTPFSLTLLLNGIGRGMEFKAHEQGLKFKFFMDEKLKDKSFQGDPSRLSQVLYNLIGNAVKFTEQGEVSLITEVMNQDGSNYIIRFKVTDTGIGISEEQQKLVFDPFQQATASTTRKFGGTGLGLAIVKQLVEMFGSEIKLKSKIGDGTCFYFDLSMQQVEQKVGDELSETRDQGEKNLSSLRILLAEDNMMNIYFMKQLFKRWNISADIAENGTEVLEMLKDADYDLILMDMHMPVMDGMQATEQIRKLADPSKAGVHIIALTASVSDQIQKRVISCGMNDYLHKPFQLDELRAKLEARLYSNAY